MFSANMEEILSLLLSIQYIYPEDTNFDYSTTPRPCHNFVFMLEGEGVIQSGENVFHLRAGDILYIPKNTTYSSRWIASPKIAFHSLHFSFNARLDPFIEKSIPVQLLPNTDFDLLYKSLKMLEKSQFVKGGNSFAILSEFYAICAKLFPHVKIQTDPLAIGKSIAPALRYIENNYTMNFKVETLAKLCYLSPSRFYFLFKKHTGHSPIVYKNQLAVQRAAHELVSDHSISVSTVAKNHGFTSTIYFERIFKKMTGKSPLQYRKQGLEL